MNVLKFRTTVKRPVTREDFMQVLRQSLYEYGDMTMLSNRTGISVACLYAIRSGRTLWPRWITFQLLMAPLGLELTLQKIEPVDRTTDTRELKNFLGR